MLLKTKTRSKKNPKPEIQASKKTRDPKKNPKTEIIKKKIKQIEFYLILLLINIILSNFSSPSLILCTVSILDATENYRSLYADVA